MEDKHFKFHSKPCPYRILLGVVGLPERKEIPLSVPRPPAFVWKKRTAKPNQEDEDGEQPIVVRAQQLPYYGESFQPKIPVRRTVEIHPFSFGSKKSLTEENKTTEERGGDRVLGLIFLPLTCRKMMNTIQAEASACGLAEEVPEGTDWASLHALVTKTPPGVMERAALVPRWCLQPSLAVGQLENLGGTHTVKGRSLIVTGVAFPLLFFIYKNI